MHLPWRDVAPGAGPVISTSVTPAEAAMLGTLATGQQVLETGSAYGYSAVTMALAGADHVTAIDPHTWLPDSLQVMLGNLAAYGVADRVEVMQEFSYTALPVLAGEGAQFGFVFVDGDHAADAVRHDIAWALKVLAPGGVLAVHDVGETCCCPDVAQVTGAMFGTEGEMVDTMLVIRP
jgi:predicted O-methyltransferase YrrM